jgi:hypothetical protein
MKLSLLIEKKIRIFIRKMNDLKILLISEKSKKKIF